MHPDDPKRVFDLLDLPQMYASQPPRDPDEVLHEQMQVVKENGYKGIFSIEHGGPDPYAEVQKVVNALLKEI